MGVSRPSDDLIKEQMHDRVKMAKMKVQANQLAQKKKYNRKEIRMAERHLLGVLHTDHKYLKSLMNNPVLHKAHYPEVENAEIGYLTQKKVSFFDHFMTVFGI